MSLQVFHGHMCNPAATFISVSVLLEEQLLGDK